MFAYICNINSIVSFIFILFFFAFTSLLLYPIIVLKILLSLKVFLKINSLTWKINYDKLRSFVSKK